MTQKYTQSVTHKITIFESFKREIVKYIFSFIIILLQHVYAFGLSLKLKFIFARSKDVLSALDIKYVPTIFGKL